MSSAPEWWDARSAFLEAPVEEDGLARMAADVVPGGSARVGTALRGGMEAAVHAVDLVAPDGTTRAAVLKRRNRPVDPQAEWNALGVAAVAEVATPEPIAVDPDGRWFGNPALVMSRLRGSTRLEAPTDSALRNLAIALASIHACPALELDVATPRWNRSIPPTTSAFEDEAWAWIAQRRADATANGDAVAGASDASALVHLDFHPGNALWDGDAVVGVVDWENGRRGWPAEDVAKCAWYLHLLHGREGAASFVTAYEATTGTRLDLLGLASVSYGVGVLPQAERRAFFLRRSGLDVDTDVVRRVTRDYMTVAMARAG